MVADCEADISYESPPGEGKHVAQQVVVGDVAVAAFGEVALAVYPVDESHQYGDDKHKDGVCYELIEWNEHQQEYDGEFSSTSRMPKYP